MRASQQLRYAIYALFDLAYHGAQGPIRVQVIGGRQAIPARYLEQIFQKLRRAGLVTSKRGPGGGYALAREPRDINLAQIAAAVQGAVVRGPDDGSRESAESPVFVWELIRSGVGAALESVTLADLCRQAAERGLRRADAEPAMYQI